ncbi:MAG: anti-sigma factor [bacterium]
MLNHNQVQSKLQDYLEQALPEVERQELESHLTECAECRQELHTLKDLVQCLEALPELDPPSDLAGTIMARVRVLPVKVSFWDRVKGWLPTLGYAYTIGLGVVYILGYLAYRYISQTNFNLLIMFKQSVIYVSNVIAKFSELGFGLWIAFSSLVRYGLPTISTCLIIETVMIIGGLYYWYNRKHKAIHLMVLN